jgi:hypothetical protein
MAQQYSIPTLKQQQPVFQTWNPVRPIAPERVLASAQFQRPICSISSVLQLKQLWALQGQGGVFVCGSYCMHSMPLLESAVTSALEVACCRIGSALPWECGEVCLYKDIDFKLKNCRLDFRLLPHGAAVAAASTAAVLVAAAAAYLRFRR